MVRAFIRLYELHKSEDKVKVFLTADTHFGHEKIVEYCARPFKDVSEMNQVW